MLQRLTHRESLRFTTSQKSLLKLRNRRKYYCHVWWESLFWWSI